MAVTQIADVVVPEIFSPYVQTLTKEKSRIIRSGAVVVDGGLSSLLGGGGFTFNDPSFKDLDQTAENVSSDDPGTNSTPDKIGTLTEIQVRLSRNMSWSSMDLSADLAGADPMNAIANRVANYWTLRLQKAFVATINGVFADNAAAPSGGDTHTQNDMTHNVSGSAFVAGVTNFSAEAFIDATATMGDSMDELGMVMMHSLVYARALKNNLIDFISDSINGQAVRIPTFLGRVVVVDDGMPRTGGVFDTWLFGSGAVRTGMNSPRVPTEVDRAPSAGNGGGQETLYNRTEWIIHPNGHAFIGSSTASGGPTNANTAGNLANAGSWRRVFPERKQVQIARLITREF
ncbi:major capsid protein [Pseudomonas phage MiCath]|uniref:Major capsid protein n=1 Tax=Pseudomonas phage MiCath TaxID=3003729 RepID=A0AAF0AFY6_9CAUD|nr:major capsid protein [Pseudomonas phage MiCath]WAX22437.1 major capsid protein [Pseudomonas phage MiCath]